MKIWTAHKTCKNCWNLAATHLTKCSNDLTTHKTFWKVFRMFEKSKQFKKLSKFHILYNITEIMDYFFEMFRVFEHMKKVIKTFLWVVRALGKMSCSQLSTNSLRFMSSSNFQNFEILSLQKASKKCKIVEERVLLDPNDRERWLWGRRTHWIVAVVCL